MFFGWRLFRVQQKALLRTTRISDGTRKPAGTEPDGQHGKTKDEDDVYVKCVYWSLFHFNVKRVIMDYGWTGLGAAAGIPIGEVFILVFRVGVLCHFFTSPVVLFPSSLFTLIYLVSLLYFTFCF